MPTANVLYKFALGNNRDIFMVFISLVTKKQTVVFRHFDVVQTVPIYNTLPNRWDPNREHRIPNVPQKYQFFNYLFIFYRIISQMYWLFPLSSVKCEPTVIWSFEGKRESLKD